MGRKKFACGDAVKTRADVDAKFRPGSFASVCGIRMVESKDESKVLNAEIGEKVYLIEFGDGASIEIPEKNIEAA